MKKFLLYTFAVFSLMGLTTSCSDFGDVNTDPEHLNPGNMDYKLLFTQVQLQACGSDWDVWRNGVIYGSTMMQHTTSIASRYGVFYTWSDDYNAAYWNIYDGGRGIIRDVIDIMYNWDENSNGYQMCRIMKAFLFHRMTDLYGDVPYTEAGKGYWENIGYPKYDTQESIYMDLLNELDDAQAKLDPSAQNTLGAADIIYGGNATQWKRFANSLMLRLAMRLTKVAPDKAETYVKKAVDNGLFTNASDNAMVDHTGGLVSDDSSEPYGKIYTESEPEKFFISEYFLNMLNTTNDPRIRFIATVCETPGNKWSSGTGSFDFGDNDPTKQKGMPIGYDLAGGDWDISKWANYNDATMGDGKYKSYFSVVNRKTYANPESPTMFVTYAENQLLLAEAAHRGWITGNAEDYYKAGVKAAMEQFSFYSAAKKDYETYMTPAVIDQYLTENPFNESKALEQINTQYYIATFCDEYETFANWRRSGYPELKSIYEAPYSRPSYPNRVSDQIPRRFTYPTKEVSDNKDNYLEAVKRLSDGDKMTSRVWWDK